MSELKDTQIRTWLVSNTASVAWAFLLGFGLTLLLLPIRMDTLPLIIIVPILTILTAAFWRKRWIPLCFLGLVATLLVNVMIPMWKPDPLTYFVRCSQITACITTSRVNEAGEIAAVYPVVDPIKWWVWSRIARNDERFRVISQGEAASGDIILHSPLERALMELNRRGRQRQVGVTIASSITLVRLNVRYTGAAALNTNVGYDRTRRTFLRWVSPADIDVPGLFSAQGRPSNMMALAREAVRADLQARLLLGGRWRDVLGSIHLPRTASLREQVRDDFIEAMLLDRTVGGGVFSLERLVALRRSLPGLAELRQVSPLADPLLRASIIGHANMLSMPGGPPSEPVRNFLDPAEAVLFEDELATIFALLASLQGSAIEVDSEAERARTLRDDWMSRLRGNRSTSRVDLALGLDILDPPARYPPFTTQNLSPRMLRSALQAARNPLDRDRILYAAAQQTREGIWSTLLGLARQGRVSITRDRFGPEFGRRLALLRSMHASLRNELEMASPVSREIITAEIRGLADTAGRLELLVRASTSSEEVEQAILGPEDQGLLAIARMGETGEMVPREMIHYTGDCEWYDPQFRDHVFLQFALLLPVTRPSERWLWETATTKLWSDYSEDGQCPHYVPGVMLLHAALSVTSDVRARQTRSQIDRLVGADAAWLAAFYRQVGRPELYEGRSRTQRLEAARSATTTSRPTPRPRPFRRG